MFGGGYPGAGSFCAPGPVGCAPSLVPGTDLVTEVWGRPVYKKKWLLGKWNYQGMEDVRVVSRPVPTAVPVCQPVPTHIPVQLPPQPVCVPSVQFDQCYQAPQQVCYDQQVCLPQQVCAPQYDQCAVGQFDQCGQFGQQAYCGDFSQQQFAGQQFAGQFQQHY